MSYTRPYSFACDADGCTYTEYVTPSPNLLAVAQQQLEQSGWFVTRNYAPGKPWSTWLHYCPEHSSDR